MIMNVRLVCMSCNDKGMLTLRETHSELLANLICFLRSDLTWFEGLPDLVGDHIAFLLPADRLLVLPFGEHPDFEAKMHEVLVVYQQIEMQFDEDGNLIIPQDEPMIHTVSCDEKPGIQAIATTSDDLCPTAERGCVYRDYEYKRLGTLSLIAGIDLLTGIAITVVSETHKSLDFICLLEKLDAMYPKGDIIRIICDNHSAHKSKEVKAYLATKPEGRFTFVFTPTHGSWLNLIEGFFSKMTKQMLKGIRVASKQELEDRIYLHFDEVNADPVVFHWSYKLDDLPTGAG